MKHAERKAVIKHAAAMAAPRTLVEAFDGSQTAEFLRARVRRAVRTELGCSLEHAETIVAELLDFAMEPTCERKRSPEFDLAVGE